jgi:aldose 1-epimerase
MNYLGMIRTANFKKIMKKSKLSILPILLVLLGGCQNNASQGEQPSSEEATETVSFTIDQMPFGALDGQEVTLYKLSASNGFSVDITNYGGTVTAIRTPDKDGQMGNVVLGFNDLDGYLQDRNPYFGCLVGRYANRIANAQFTLNGATYNLAANDNGNTLHGGEQGFDKRIWSAETNITDEAAELILTYVSEDGEEGYPGKLTTQVTYSIGNNYDLSIDYEATTDQPTPVNLTNHAYFNLSAGAAPDVLGHELMLNASTYTAVGAGLIPTGEIAEVAGSPMDFTSSKLVGRDIAQVEGGFDHNWILNKKMDGLTQAATLYEPNTGRFMEMLTTEPAVQFYSGNFLDGSLTNKDGKTIVKHYGLCLEAQHYPDSPNQADFPGVILEPGETYRQTTIYRFSVK